MSPPFAARADAEEDAECRAPPGVKQPPGNNDDAAAAAAEGVQMKHVKGLSAVFLAVVVLDWCTSVETTRATEASAALLLVAIPALALAEDRASLQDTASLLLVGACMSPVLGSLTRTYASDTVTLLTRLSLALYLLAGDSPVALNAGFTAMLLMASRLESSLLVFAFAVTCTLLLFVLPSTALISPRLLAAATTVVVSAQLGARAGVTFAASAWFMGSYCPALLDGEDVVHIRGKWDLLHVEEEEETGLITPGFPPASSPRQLRPAVQPM